MSPRTTEQNEMIREQRKKAILEAALTVFAQRGYMASTIDQVAAAAEISKGLVYNYFNSKEDLLKEIFNYIMQETDELWILPEDATPAEKLKILLDGTFSYLEDHPKIMRLMTQLAMQPDAVNDLKEVIDAAQLGKFMMMEPMLAEMGYDNPREETYFLGALLDGISLGWMIMGDAYPIDQMKNRIYAKYNLI